MGIRGASKHSDILLLMEAYNWNIPVLALKKPGTEIYRMMPYSKQQMQ